MTKQTAPPAIVRISTNTIWEGKFYNRGEPLPVASVADLTENLRPLVITGEPEPEEENTARGSFETGVIYEMTPDGRLGRALRRNVQRQVAELEAENAQEEWIKEEAASAELPATIAEELNEEHQRHVGLQATQLAAAARASDDIADGAIAAAEPSPLFVKRGLRHYVEIHRTKLKPGEPVFTKDLADGAYACIGISDSKPQPPDLPITT